MLESDVDGDELGGVAVAPVLVNGIADVVAVETSEAETISPSSPESLATRCEP